MTLISEAGWLPLAGRPAAPDCPFGSAGVPLGNAWVWAQLRRRSQHRPAWWTEPSPLESVNSDQPTHPRGGPSLTRTQPTARVRPVAIPDDDPWRRELVEYPSRSICSGVEATLNREWNLDDPAEWGPPRDRAGGHGRRRSTLHRRRRPCRPLAAPLLPAHVRAAWAAWLREHRRLDPACSPALAGRSRSENR